MLLRYFTCRISMDVSFSLLYSSRTDLLAALPSKKQGGQVFILYRNYLIINKDANHHLGIGESEVSQVCRREAQKIEKVKLEKRLPI